MMPLAALPSRPATRIECLAGLVLFVATLTPLAAAAQEAAPSAPQEATVSAPAVEAPAPAPAPAVAPPVPAAAPVQYIQLAPPVAQPAPAPQAVVAAPYPYQLPPPAWAPRYPAEAQSYVLPPLPAGYVYVPTPTSGQLPAAAPAPAPAPVDVARQAQLYDELRMIDGRVDTLQRERVRLGGPIALMVLGYGTTLVGMAVGLASYGAAESIQSGDYRVHGEDDHDDLDFNEDGQVNHRDEELFRRTARISTGVAAAGLVLGILGTSSLVHRRRERRTQKQELSSLTQRRDSLRSQLNFGAGFAPGQVSASLSGRY